MAVYKTDYEIGEEVWRVIKEYIFDIKSSVWVSRPFIIDKITITKTSISYHCYRYSDIGGSWIFGNRVLYRDKQEADKVAWELNKQLGELYERKE